MDVMLNTSHRSGLEYEKLCTKLALVKHLCKLGNLKGDARSTIVACEEAQLSPYIMCFEAKQFLCIPGRLLNGLGTAYKIFAFQFQKGTKVNFSLSCTVFCLNNIVIELQLLCLLFIYCTLYP